MTRMPEMIDPLMSTTMSLRLCQFIIIYTPSHHQRGCQRHSEVVSDGM